MSSAIRNTGLLVILVLLARTLSTNLIYGKSSAFRWSTKAQRASVAESVMIFPLHGIQLETHRGFLWWELSKTQTFLPFSIFDEFFINEALFGWNVRYYIATKVRRQEGTYSLHVAFPVSLEFQEQCETDSSPSPRTRSLTSLFFKKCTQTCKPFCHVAKQDYLTCKLRKIEKQILQIHGIG